MELTHSHDDKRRYKVPAAAAYKVMRYHPDRGADGIVHAMSKRGCNCDTNEAFGALCDAQILIGSQQDVVLGA